MSNKSTDNTGYSWQTYDNHGNKIQENSKTWSGEHKWYNSNNGYQGYHGENMSESEKQIAGDYFRNQQNQRRK